MYVRDYSIASISLQAGIAKKSNRPFENISIFFLSF